jgi:hypothetical protein
MMAIDFDVLTWLLPQVTCQLNGPLNATFSPASLVLFDGPNTHKEDEERSSRYAKALRGNVRLWRHIPGNQYSPLCDM